MRREFEAELSTNPRTLDNNPRPIDIELAAQWALAQIGPLPWLRVGDRDLAFNRGITAQARRRPHVGWELASACAGVAYKGRPIVAHKKPHGDAELIVEAIKRLPPHAGSLIIRHARNKTRPDAMIGVEPRPMPAVDAAGAPKVTRTNGKRGKRCRYVPEFCSLVWLPEPEAICRSRADYEAWHAGLTALMEAVRDQLTRWRINGFGAPAEPWR